MKAIFSFFISVLIKINTAHLIKGNENAQQFRDPCAALKCASNEICVLKDAEHAICLLRNEIEISPSFYRKKRELKTDICMSDECKQGECEILSSISYKCHCNQMGILGTGCDLVSVDADPCSSNPCWGNSECINLNNSSFECKCKNGRAGYNCAGHSHPCKCLNGGFCSLIGKEIYICKCPINYGGYLCQYKLYSSSDKIQIQTRITSCFKKPCQNGGVCTIFSVCLCKPGFTGDFCETSLKPMAKSLYQNSISHIQPKQACFHNMCLNGGTCSQLTNSIAVCFCLLDYSGPFCNIKNTNNEIKTTSNRILTSFISTTTTTTTTKTTTFTTTSTTPIKTTTTATLNTSKVPVIENVQASSLVPCPNNFNSICLNNGECFVISNSVVYCLCQLGFSGPFCEKKNKSLANISQLNTAHTSSLVSSTTMPILPISMANLQSTTTTILPVLESDSYACPYLFRVLCQNGGICHTPESDTSTYYCVCQQGFAGPFCNNKIESTFDHEEDFTYPTTATTTSTTSTTTTSSLIISCPMSFRNLCLNGGECQLVSGTSTYFCRCSKMFTGPFCNIHVN